MRKGARVRGRFAIVMLGAVSLAPGLWLQGCANCGEDSAAPEAPEPEPAATTPRPIRRMPLTVHRPGLLRLGLEAGAGEGQPDGG